MQPPRAWTMMLLGAALFGCSGRDDPKDCAPTADAEAAGGAPAGLSCAGVVDKLAGCGLISGTQLKDCADGDRLAACLASCVDGASCAQMKAGYCDDAFNAFSGCLNECHEAPPPDYVCADGSSIPASFRCDGGPDCPDGEDEACPKGSFTCENGLAIPAGWRCDTVDDCEDGEDELDCPGSPTLTCDDGTQFPARRRCDGASDCAGGEDELDCVVLTCE